MTRPARRRLDVTAVCLLTVRISVVLDDQAAPLPQPPEPEATTVTSRIYTKLGDDGSTGRLFGGRLSKADELIEVLGTIDEAVAALGLARALAAQNSAESDAAGVPSDELDTTVASEHLTADILRIQRDLFVVAADLGANPRARDRLTAGVSLVTAAMVADLEATIDRMVARRPLRPVFVVPGANPASAALDMARTGVRRAERRLVAYQLGQQASPAANPHALAYLNRLSDLLFVMARHAAGETEEPASHGTTA